MKSAINAEHASNSGTFNATVNGKPFLTTALTGTRCLRPELSGMRTRHIWNLHVAGQVARRRTMIGFFIDQVLTPGTYDLVGNDHLSVVYHLTPRQFARVYHSQHFQQGRVTLLECDTQTGRLRGTFDFAMSATGFKVADGEFDLVCETANSAE
jgi:hypothetical protein